MVILKNKLLDLWTDSPLFPFCLCLCPCICLCLCLCCSILKRILLLLLLLFFQKLLSRAIVAFCFQSFSAFWWKAEIGKICKSIYCRCCINSQICVLDFSDNLKRVRGKIMILDQYPINVTGLLEIYIHRLSLIPIFQFLQKASKHRKYFPVFFRLQFWSLQQNHTKSFQVWEKEKMSDLDRFGHFEELPLYNICHMGSLNRLHQKTAALCRNLCHIWRDCSKELNWILILNNRPYVAWIVRIGLVRDVFFSFCYFVLHLSLVHWLQWRFTGSRAIDKVQLMDTCHNMLVTFPNIVPLCYIYHILTKCNWWTHVTTCW